MNKTFEIGDRVKIVQALIIDRSEVPETVGVMATVVESEFHGQLEIKLDQKIDALTLDGEYPADFYAWPDDDPDIQETLQPV